MVSDFEMSGVVLEDVGLGEFRQVDVKEGGRDRIVARTFPR